MLTQVSDALSISPTLAGLLTTLPVLAFAVFGGFAGEAIRRAGLTRTAALALVVIAAGLLLRAATSSVTVFVLASALSLAGCAIGNVILPPLVKQYFPDRIPMVSAVYGAAIVGGASIASMVTVPISDAAGSWRVGLGSWAVLAVATLVPWIWLLRDDVRAAAHVAPLPMRVVMSSPLAWQMVALFALQSAQAYAQFGWYPAILVDQGHSEAYAGLMLGILAGTGIPTTLALPWVMNRVRPAVLPWTFGAVTVAGWLGVLLGPEQLVLLWSILLGIGSGAFTWSLTMIGQRTRTPAATTALSAFVQGLGYLLASLGPLLTGVLHDTTGDWTVPITVLAVAAIGIAIAGTPVARGTTLEDTLRRR
ncbi:UNVERIFIED_CONTAM: hypothetical protein LK11_20220 [Mumia flava]